MLSIARLDIADARILIAAARAKAEAIGVPMCIAITDESGNLIAFERMDGGKVTSTTIAIDKAYTAAAAKKATHEYGAASQPGSPAYGINSAIGGRLMVVGGGLPVIVGGAVVGGIGASSGTPTQDTEVAQAGVDGLLATMSTVSRPL
ncbi:GlcG/HbpS family heme-binding protein [Devosia lacusdianchii]|uniref:GlcG/HbpS family heme-binding protein n=1 Tax=Devosia lacusdianchii TaxID=2917991 RepID=UPI001F060C87|nr:heme-binding protein [Devosia sp. JXJ CY 41]